MQNIDGGLSQPAKRVLFASAHSIVDFSNGALLPRWMRASSGWVPRASSVQAFCTSRLDFERDVHIEAIIGDLREPYQIRPSTCGHERARPGSTRNATASRSR